MSVASAVDILQRTHADVKCDSNTRQLLNGLCDGSKDRVIWGSERGKVWVAVVSGKQRQNDRILSFPIAGAVQNGFCSLPSRIEIRPFNCESDQGTLPGCKLVQSCQEFTVIDDDCDPFNFYWDSSRKSLSWWRNWLSAKCPFHSRSDYRQSRGGRWNARKPACDLYATRDCCAAFTPCVASISLSRKTRHLAAPPALRNSVSGT